MMKPVSFANSQSIDSGIDSMDLLRDESSISIESNSSATTTSAPRIGKKIDKFLDRSKKSLVSSFKDLGYLRQIDEDRSIQEQQHVPFQSISKGKSDTSRECVVCVGMAVALAIVLAGMFGIILLLAFHPSSPTVSIDRVSNGTLFLYTDANSTILVARFNLTMLAKNANTNAAMRFRSSSLGFWFGNRTLGRFQVRTFTQPAKEKNMPFRAFIDSTTNLTGSVVEDQIRNEFRQQNATFGVSGNLPVQRRVANVVPSNGVVRVNCTVSFSPSFPPVVLAKDCLQGDTEW